MIGSVLTDLAPRVTHADVVRTTDHTLAVEIDSRGEAQVTEDRLDTVQVRVGADGRVGWAGGATSDLGQIVPAALRSAAAGPTLALLPPAPSPLPSVATSSPAARALSVSDLLECSRRLAERLSRRDWTVSTWAERSAGLVEVGNTRGVLASYEVTLTGIGARVQGPAGGPVCQLSQSQAGPPDTIDLERLVTRATERLGPPAIEEPILPSSARVWLAPPAVRAVLEPLLTRLIGHRGGAPDEAFPPVDERLTLIDDPLVPGRPGSRPICDDGVVTRELVLIERGRARQRILDLVSASRRGLPATGHGWRRGWSGPRTGFSNVRLAAGEVPRDQLPRMVGEGLLLAELELGPAPNRGNGVFRVQAPWAYRIAGGSVVGRVEGVVVSGDVFELLGQVVAVGADLEWLGAAELPSLVVDGVGVTVR